jgi:hypothetical protein
MHSGELIIWVIFTDPLSFSPWASAAQVARERTYIYEKMEALGNTVIKYIKVK